MSTPTDAPQDRLSPDDALPPVEPPSAGFIIQLFVIPAVIVLVIVLVYMMFTWLASAGADPKSYVDEIERNNANSWQAAHNLAVELQRNPELKQNAELAEQLAKLLEVRLDSPLPTGRAEETEMRLREYLCGALAEFEGEAALDALVAAASPEKDQNFRVQGAALEGIAVHLSQHESSSPEQVLAVLQAAAQDSESQIRVRAAYALGVYGEPPADKSLRQLLGDDESDVRYNAATGLARMGDPAAVPVLVQMLDPDRLAELETSSQEDRVVRDRKDAYLVHRRAILINNAFKAADLLVPQTDPEDLQPLTGAVQDLLDADLETLVPGTTAEQIRQAGRVLLERLPPE